VILTEGSGGVILTEGSGGVILTEGTGGVILTEGSGQHWWSDTDRGQSKYSDSATLSSTNLAQRGLGSKPGVGVERPV
jgi:hypothetical protein